MAFKDHRQKFFFWWWWWWWWLWSPKKKMTKSKKNNFFLFIFWMNQSLLSPKKVVPNFFFFWENCWHFQLFFCVQNPLLGQIWLIWSLKKKCWGEVIFFWIFWVQIWPKSWDLELWEGSFGPLKSKKRPNFFGGPQGRKRGARPPWTPGSSRS